jgi:putative oxidoreductase
MNLRSLLFGSSAAERGTDAGLLILRVGLGLALALAHGLGKMPPGEGLVGATAALGFPLPTFFAWAAALSEFVGALLIVVGLATRPAALFVAITMAVAFFGQHAADPFADKELAFVYLVWALGLLVAGAGRYALDARLAPRI